MPEFHAKCLRKQQHTLTLDQIHLRKSVVMQLHFLRREKSKGGYAESDGREDGGQKSLVVFSDSKRQWKNKQSNGV